MWVALLVLLVMLGVEQFLARDDLKRLRAVQKQWRAIWSTVTAEDRRLVRRAVREGRAVEDAKLAPAAVALAEVAVAARRAHPLRWVNLSFAVLVFSWAPVAEARRGNWGLALLLAVVPVLLVVVSLVPRINNARAAEALEANRRLAGQA